MLFPSSSIMVRSIPKFPLRLKYYVYHIHTRTQSYKWKAKRTLKFGLISLDTIVATRYDIPLQKCSTVIWQASSSLRVCINSPICLYRIWQIKLYKMFHDVLYFWIYLFTRECTGNTGSSSQMRYLTTLNANVPLIITARVIQSDCKMHMITTSISALTRFYLRKYCAINIEYIVRAFWNIHTVLRVDHLTI